MSAIGGKAHIGSASPITAPPAVSTRRCRSSLGACVLVPERGLSSVRHLNPLRVWSALGVIVVVPVPPLVRRGLRIAWRRVFPGLLAAERRDIEITPGGRHRVVGTTVSNVGVAQ